MTRRSVGMLAVAAVVLAAAGCGVRAESTPEPLPATAPVVPRPTVTQEPATITPSTPRPPQPRGPASTTPPP